MTPNTFWTFCVPQFLLHFYLKREAKAGFDKQGWILFLRFISTGGTLWDKNSVSQKPEPGNQATGSKSTGNPCGAHHWEASWARNSNHSSPWTMRETSPSPGHIWGIIDAEQEKLQKAKVPSDPEVTQRTLWESGSPHCGSHNQAHIAEVLEAHEMQPSPNAQGYLGPPRHMWDTYRQQTLQRLCAEQVPQLLWPGDPTSPIFTALTLLHSWHRLGTCVSWMGHCLHILKGHCETRQSTTMKINDGDEPAGSRLSQERGEQINRRNYWWSVIAWRISLRKKANQFSLKSHDSNWKK